MPIKDHTVAYIGTVYPNEYLEYLETYFTIYEVSVTTVDIHVISRYALPRQSVKTRKIPLLR